MEELHVRVPERRLAGRLDDVDAEDALGEGEEAVEDVGQRKVGAQLLLLEPELLLRLPLRPVWHVPERERVAAEAPRLGEGRELGKLALRGGHRLAEEHLGELIDGADALRHLPLERHLGVRLVPQDARLLLPQLEDLADEGRVLVARPRHERAVELLAHGALLEELHRRQVRGHVQAHLPRAALRRRPRLARLDGA